MVKEGVVVDVPSVPIRTGREQDEDGDYKRGNQWSSYENMGTQRQKKQDEGNTLNLAFLVTCAHLTSGLISDPSDSASPVCCDPSGQEQPLYSCPLRTVLAFKTNLGLHTHNVLTLLALPFLWGSSTEYLGVTWKWCRWGKRWRPHSGCRTLPSYMGHRGTSFPLLPIKPKANVA